MWFAPITFEISSGVLAFRISSVFAIVANDCQRSATGWPPLVWSNSFVNAPSGVMIRATCGLFASSHARIHTAISSNERSQFSASNRSRRVLPSRREISLTGTYPSSLDNLPPQSRERTRSDILLSHATSELLMTASRMRSASETFWNQSFCGLVAAITPATCCGSIPNRAAHRCAMRLPPTYHMRERLRYSGFQLLCSHTRFSTMSEIIFSTRVSGSPVSPTKFGYADINSTFFANLAGSRFAVSRSGCNRSSANGSSVTFTEVGRRGDTRIPVNEFS